MGILNEAAVESIELEQVGKEIALVWPTFDGLFAEFTKSAKKVNISNVTSGAGTTRSAWRETLLIQGGSGISIGTGDGSALGSGTGSLTASFVMAPIWAFNVTQYSRLAELATSGAERGVEAITKTEFKRSLKQFRNGLEGLVNGDGSGAFDQIVAGSTVVNNTGSGAQLSSVSVGSPAVFVDQQVVQFFASEGGSARSGTATISYVDHVAGVLYFSTALPSGTAAGDYIMPYGASGAAGSSVLGVPYWNTNGNSGTVGGLARASYPGRLSTPVINLNAPVTPSVMQRAEVLMTRAIGDDAETDKGVWYGKPDQLATMASQWYSLNISHANEKGGADVFDRAKSGFQTAFGERKFIHSNSAKNGRIDLLFPENWSMGELCPVQQYDFGGGNVVMPVPDTSGNAGATYLTEKMFVYEWAGQLCNRNPRHGVYITNAQTITI